TCLHGSAHLRAGRAAPNGPRPESQLYPVDRRVYLASPQGGLEPENEKWEESLLSCPRGIEGSPRRIGATERRFVVSWPSRWTLEAGHGSTDSDPRCPDAPDGALCDVDRRRRFCRWSVAFLPSLLLLDLRQQWRARADGDGLVGTLRQHHGQALLSSAR